MWIEFDCKTMKDYLMLYLFADVFLLSCVFLEFAMKAHKTYQLSVYHNSSLSSYAYWCLMYQSRADFQFIKDLEMIEMIHEGIRGGSSVLCNKFLKANNEACENYDPKLPRSHILYADANSLYPSCFLENMPHSSYEWLEEEELNKIDFLNLSPNHEYGYVLNVDLKYDPVLHDAHKYFPMALEHRVITDSQVSVHQREQYDLYKGWIGNPFKTKRLVATLLDKTNYVLYNKNLQYYLQMGMSLTRINKGFRFLQTNWLSEVVQTNLKCEMRKNAKDEITSMIIKGILNRAYGVFLMSTRLYVDTEICMTRTRALTLLKRHNFRDCKQVSNEAYFQ